MNKTILKEIIKLKLRAVDRAAGLLPQDAGDRLKKCRNELLEAVANAAQEYREGSAAPEEGRTLKNIAVD